MEQWKGCDDVSRIEQEVALLRNVGHGRGSLYDAHTAYHVYNFIYVGIIGRYTKLSGIG